MLGLGVGLCVGVVWVECKCVGVGGRCESVSGGWDMGVCASGWECVCGGGEWEYVRVCARVCV